MRPASIDWRSGKGASTVGSTRSRTMLRTRRASTMQTTKATIAMPTLPSEMVTLPTLTPRISWPRPVDDGVGVDAPRRRNADRQQQDQEAVEQQHHQMLAAQGRIGRQAEAVAHPAAGRRVGRSGLLEQIADQAMRQQRR